MYIHSNGEANKCLKNDLNRLEIYVQATFLLWTIQELSIPAANLLRKYEASSNPLLGTTGIGVHPKLGTKSKMHENHFEFRTYLQSSWELLTPWSNKGSFYSLLEVPENDYI